MFINQMPRYEILSEEAMATLDKGWKRILTELGIEFMKPEALDLFRAAGQRVDENKVFLDPEFVLEQIAKAPREFDMQARNHANDVHIGGNHMVFSAVYGAPFVDGRHAPRWCPVRLSELREAFPEFYRDGFRRWRRGRTQ